MNQNRFLIRLVIIAIAVALSMVLLPAVNADPADGLVASWHFDEGTDSVVTDSSSNGNDGTLSGGMFGNALYFDGNDDYISIPDSLSLDSITDLTIELWVKPSVDYVSNPLFYVFASKYTDSNSFQFVYHPNGYLYLYVTNGIAVQSIPVALNAGTWYHLAATFDSGTSNGKIFVDGVNVTQSQTVKTMTQNDMPFCIGVRADTSLTTPTHEVKGTIDEVRLSNNIRYTSDFTPQTEAFSDVYDVNTIGLWHFDESVGATAYDSSGNGNNGDIHGATWAGPTWTDGYFGKALNFDGIDDCVEIPDDSSLDITGEITLEVWMNPSVINTYKSMIVKGNAEDDSKITYGLQIQGEGIDGIIRYFQYGSSYSWIDSTVPVTQNVWNYIAVTRDSSNNVKIYLNGELVGSGTLLSGPINDYPLDIGMHNHATLGADQYFDGKLDEIRIWNRILSSEEVKTHAWGLVGEWDFDEGCGTDVFDSSGFGHDGSLAPVSSEPIWVDLGGGTEYSLDFDGVNDHVEIGISKSLDVTEQITVEAMIQLDSIGGTIIRKGAYPITDPAPTWGFDIQGGKLRAFIYDEGTAYIAYGSTSLVTDTWYHVSFTYDGSAVRIYLDGTLDGSVAHIGDIDGSDSPVWISRKNGVDYLNGQIDEVHIWNQALVPITFDQTGLDCSAYSELVVTVSDPIPLDYEDLPYIMMVPVGTEMTYEFQDSIDGGPGKRFELQDVTGGASPSGIGVAPTAIVGNYVTQFEITFDHTGLTNDASCTVVSYEIDSGPSNYLAYDDLPHTIWVDGGSTVTYSFLDPVASTLTDKQYRLDSVSGCGSGFTVSGSDSVIGNYVIQYYLTVQTDPSGLTSFTEDGWHDVGESVGLSAPDITGYTFLYWDVDTQSQGDGVNPITVTMDSAHTATAHYFEWVKVEGKKYVSIDGTQTTTTSLNGWNINLYTFCDNFDVTPEGTDPAYWSEHGVGTWSVKKDDSAPSQGSAGFGDVYVGDASSTVYTRDFSFNTIASGFSDGVFEFKFKLDSASTPTPRITIPVRYQDDSNWLMFDIDTGLYRTGYYIFSSQTAWTELAGKTATITKDEWHTMKIVLDGWDYELWIDDVLELTAHDTVQLYSSGEIGLGVYRDTIASFDDVCLYETTTTADIDSSIGKYTFDIKKPGTYILKEEVKDGWSHIYPEAGQYTLEITEEDAGETFERSFWNFKWVTISGYKYEYNSPFCDDFESYGLGTDASSIWNVVGGIWNIVDESGDYVYQGTRVEDDPYDAIAISNLNYGTKDMSIEVDFKELGGNDWKNGFIIFDYNGPNDFKFAGLAVGAKEYRIQHYEGGVGGIRDSVLSDSSISANTWYTLKVVINDNTVSLYVDNDKKIEYTYPSIGTGKIGLLSWSANGLFDDFCAIPDLNPLENWNIELYEDSTRSETVDTNSDGYYEFIVTRPGNYAIKEELEPGWTKIYPTSEGHSITVVSGEDIPDLDFWNFKWTTISGYKFFDGNDNRINDVGEPGLEHWIIGLYNEGAEIDTATTDCDGKYQFTITEPGVYSLKETLIADWWERTTPNYTFVPSSGESVTYDFGNWLGPSIVTTSGLCWFDMDEAEGRQFRVIFTPDIENNVNEYKVSATNPGQFYYNVFYTGTVTEGFEISLPDTFETQGAEPVHVYSSLNTNEFGCLIPGEEILDAVIDQDGNLITVDIAEYTGFVYIAVHCDYAPKQTGGYEAQLYSDGVDGPIYANARNDDDDIDDIMDLGDHEFTVSGDTGDSQIIQNRNEFKKFRGIIGFVTNGENPVPGVTVTITSDVLDGPVTFETDEDGFYGWNYFHLGKPAEYQIQFENDAPSIGESITIKLKAGHFEEVSLDISTP